MMTIKETQLTISYAILSHNQGSKLQKLVDRLINNIDQQDQIVIVDDYSDDNYTINLLNEYKKIYNIKVEYRHLYNNFSSQKNYLFDLCYKDYIFNLDADQLITQQLIMNIKTVLSENNDVQLF